MSNNTIQNNTNYIFTSESVTSGHPDKVCDQVSDAILDACLSQDPFAKVAVDCWVKGNNIGLIGELTTTAKIDFEQIVRAKILEIGYDHKYGFDGNTVKIHNLIGEQSPEINKAVFGTEIGAGDQGLVFGFACNQTPNLMPLAIDLSHKLAKKLETVRKEFEKMGKFVLGPDGKTQVSIGYKDNKVDFIDTILISTQHSPELKNIRDLILESVILPVLKENNLMHLATNTKFLINPSGSFVIGGPEADSGLTGRKIVVDGYGGFSRVGGGAFSGKDASKVDRSAAYMARFLAKNIVAKGWANTCEIQISYAIGVAEPVSLAIFGDLIKVDSEILAWIKSNYSLTPKNIIKTLDLQKPVFGKTSSYGHFGNPDFAWEKIISNS